MEEKRRIHLLDELRGFAVLCMLIHHTILSVGEIFYIQKLIDLFNFLCIFQPIIWFLFFAGSGISSRLSRSNLKRGLRLFGISLIVTAVTYAYFNGGGTIVFGALHFLSVAMVIFHFLKPIFVKINPIIGACVCFALLGFTYGVYDGYVGIFSFVKVPLPTFLYSTSFLFWLGLPKADFVSVDYFPLIPYIFIFFIGCFLGSYIEKGKVPACAYKKRCAPLSFLGRYALVAYIAHQPVIYAVCYLIRRVS